MAEIELQAKMGLISDVSLCSVFSLINLCDS